MARLIHEVKTWPEVFEAAWNGLKPFEIRKDDRNYEVGHILRQREWRPHPANQSKTGSYTGRVIVGEITYKSPGGKWGMPDDLCVLGLRSLHQGIVEEVDAAERTVVAIDTSIQFAPEACRRAMLMARALLTKDKRK